MLLALLARLPVSQSSASGEVASEHPSAGLPSTPGGRVGGLLWMEEESLPLSASREPKLEGVRAVGEKEDLKRTAVARSLLLPVSSDRSRTQVAAGSEETAAERN